MFEVNSESEGGVIMEKGITKKGNKRKWYCNAQQIVQLYTAFWKIDSSEQKLFIKDSKLFTCRMPHFDERRMFLQCY